MMKETEFQCSICRRYLTPEELNINKVNKGQLQEAKCYYCIVRALSDLNKISDIQYPVPLSQDFGREDGEDPDKLEEKNNENLQEDTAKSMWPEETVIKLKEELGLDLTEKIEEHVYKSKQGIKSPLPISHKITQISARGVSEDISLVFTVPREILDPRLAPAIQQGLNNILMALMNMLTFAPLHNGMMEQILKPPQQNPFFPPQEGPNNLFGE